MSSLDCYFDGVDLSLPFGKTQIPEERFKPTDPCESFSLRKDSQGYLSSPPPLPQSSSMSFGARYQAVKFGGVEDDEDEEVDESPKAAKEEEAMTPSEMYTNPSLYQEPLDLLLPFEEGEEPPVGVGICDLLTREFGEGQEKEQQKEENGEKKDLEDLNASLSSSPLSFSSFGTPDRSERENIVVDWNARFQKCVEKLSDEFSCDVSVQVGQERVLEERGAFEREGGPFKRYILLRGGYYLLLVVGSSPPAGVHYYYLLVGPRAGRSRERAVQERESRSRERGGEAFKRERGGGIQERGGGAFKREKEKERERERREDTKEEEAWLV